MKPRRSTKKVRAQPPQTDTKTHSLLQGALLRRQGSTHWSTNELKIRASLAEGLSVRKNSPPKKEADSGTSSNLLTSLESRLTIWPVVVFPMAELLRRRACKETSCRCTVAQDRPSFKHTAAFTFLSTFSLRCALTHLHVDHVAHGHSDLHPGPLHIVEVEVMQERQADGANRQAGGVAERDVKGLMIARGVVLKVQNQLSQEDGLHHFNDFLRRWRGRKTGREMERNESDRTTIIA